MEYIIAIISTLAYLVIIFGISDNYGGENMGDRDVYNFEIKKSFIESCCKYLIYLIASMLGIWVIYFLGTESYFNSFSTILPNLDNNESQLRADFGAFGDFFGGVLNPVIGLISVILIFITYRQMKREFKETHKYMEQQKFEDTFFKLMEHHNRLAENKYFNADKDISTINICCGNIQVILDFLNTKETSIQNTQQIFFLKANLLPQFIALFVWWIDNKGQLDNYLKFLQKNNFFEEINCHNITNLTSDLFQDRNDANEEIIRAVSKMFMVTYKSILLDSKI